MKFASLITVVALFALRAAAAPTEPPVEGEVYPCANANKDVCPSGYTCCGPLRIPEGGVCRKLEPNQACLF